MRNTILDYPSTRREFLVNGSRGIGLLAFSRFAPVFLTRSALAQAPPPEKDRTILVLIQLAGGNDGLNTLVPLEDPNYYRLRPRLGLGASEIIGIDDRFGFHPNMTELAELFREGKLSVIQNVGYPNPNRSHFRSTEIWETASGSDGFLSSGWMGRFLDCECGEMSGAGSNDPEAIHVTGQVPQSFSSAKPHSLFGMHPRHRPRTRNDNRELLQELARNRSELGNLGFLQQATMDALITEERVQTIIRDYRPLSEYPSSRLGRSLRHVGALIAQGLETRVYFVSQGGYDTHTNQQPTQARLLGELSAAMAAFARDLEAHGLHRQVLTMTFSEFGRRPSENDGKGTDHGTAAPLFVMGTELRDRMVGKAPDLDLDKKQDLAFSTDFRSVYATVLDRWLSCSSSDVLGGVYPHLSFI